jgi:hypothetical protein
MENHMVVAEETAAERVSGFTFTIARGEDGPESRDQWIRRSEVLASWLMSEWLHERGGQEVTSKAREMAKRN